MGIDMSAWAHNFLRLRGQQHNIFERTHITWSVLFIIIFSTLSFPIDVRD